MTLLDIGIFLGAFLVIAMVLLAVGGNPSQKRQQARVAKLKERKAGGKPETAPASLRRKQDDDSIPLMRLLARYLPRRDTLQARLEKTGKGLSVERYLFICVALFTVVLFLVAGLLRQGFLLGTFLGIIVGLGIPHLLVGYWGAKRLKAFVRLFPDAIDLIVRGLRSGLPVSESVQVVSREIPEPVGSTFLSMSDSMKLGVPLEKALQDTALKLRCTEFDFFATSIILQRETGGNLSEILNNLADVLRQRFMMRLKIRALSSEARASAIIIGALPFFVMLVVFFLSPGYLDPLFHDPRGHISGGIAIGMLLLGLGIMAKMTRFEI